MMRILNSNLYLIKFESWTINNSIIKPTNVLIQLHSSVFCLFLSNFYKYGFSEKPLDLDARSYSSKYIYIYIYIYTLPHT